jgi:hypothetical protein
VRAAKVLDVPTPAGQGQALHNSWSKDGKRGGLRGNARISMSHTEAKSPLLRLTESVDQRLIIEQSTN